MSEAAAAVLDIPALRLWAAGVHGRALAAWPAFSVSEAELAEIAALRRSACGPRDSPTAFDELDAAELYLAAGCVRGDPAALQALRQRFFDPVAPRLRRRGIGPASLEDVWQILCERLLVRSAGDPPRIARYAGTGELHGLIRVAATRVALNWLDKERRREAVGDDLLSRLAAATPDPELHAMKHQHRTEFKQELETAVADLSAQDRMILRLHIVQRLGIDGIASICSVHRATAARMVARAKDRLATVLRERLARRWRLAGDDLRALKSLIDSQLDLSLQRLLAP
jgi:RNA polymerase sigma-70 factor (ECF subfamily)